MHVRIKKRTKYILKFFKGVKGKHEKDIIYLISSDNDT